MIEWQNEMRQSVKDPSHFELTPYAVNIPEKLLARINTLGIDSPLGRQFLPHTDENNQAWGFQDPIGDDINSMGGGIIHRYQSRILFSPTIHCPIACRYCFRKNQLTPDNPTFKQNLNQLKSYLVHHIEVNEVILTGGDPLVLSDSKLAQILDILIEAKIKYVRFHTRTPVIIPSRLNESFIQLLEQYQRKFKRIFFVLHTNHLSEFTAEVDRHLLKLNPLNISKLTQTVLLKDVNNNESALIDLFQHLTDLGFQPYYLHHPDQVRGAKHFYLPIEEGKKIYLNLRQRLSGWAIPHYIVDSPDGSGKKLIFQT